MCAGSLRKVLLGALASAALMALSACSTTSPFASSALDELRVPLQYLRRRAPHVDSPFFAVQSARRSLVTTIQSPTLGSPLRYAGAHGVPFSVLVNEEPDPAWTYWLVPRECLDVLAREPYALRKPLAGVADFAADLNAVRHRLRQLESVQGAFGPVLHAESRRLETEYASTSFTRVARAVEQMKVIANAWSEREHPDVPRDAQGTLRLVDCAFAGLIDPTLPDHAYAAVRDDSLFQLWLRVLHRRNVALGAVSDGHAVPLIVQSIARVANGRDVHSVTLAPGVPVPVGLYSLAITDGRRLVDVQFNSVFVPVDASSTPCFAVAGDIQWGRKREVVEACLRFVQLVNVASASTTRAPATARPEFLVLVGDVVDCSYLSAHSSFGTITAQTEDYARDYVQAWLTLAALDVPVYVLPGNHDGYCFPELGFWETVFKYAASMFYGYLGAGATRDEEVLFEFRFGSTLRDIAEYFWPSPVDGSALFESTFGPTHYSFDIGNRRFVALNSYDLPRAYRTLGTTDASSLAESLANKFNKMNWGGGIRHDQHRWLKAVLDDAKQSGKEVTLFMHHDPLGAYPDLRATRREKEHATPSPSRHVNVAYDRLGRGAMLSRLAPSWHETEEVHAGAYTPLRSRESEIRTSDWFSSSPIAPIPDSARGFPGWLRYQQEWHSNYTYAGGLDSTRELGVEASLVSPIDLLETIAKGRVSSIFKGHDNRFCRSVHPAKEPILKMPADQQGLLGNGEVFQSFRQSPLERELNVYHVADVSDADSDGHGFYLVTPTESGFFVDERGHW